MSSVVGRRWAVRLAQTGVVLAALVPLAVLVRDAFGDRLGANPVEAIEHRTGDWTIWLLLSSLAVTPLRRLTGWNWLIRYRRTLGLLAFSYVCLHFLTYLVIDQGFPIQGLTLTYVWEDIVKRPYVTVGFTAFLLLIPIAWTSTKGWIRRLGRRWTTLHQLVYVAAALGVLHYMWLIKGDRPTAVYHALVLVGLLGARVWKLRATLRSPDAPRAAAPLRAPLPGPASDPS
ncbi:MAG TPA: protein-methionine-sulfoxide reductase heme-binding subunit MsrQ [Gemmatimonadales bacterium]|nr:protein-methionine-sulfoxide reductase heme-binding subunit MsrQ [Gemmatimonadales bacterium]